MRTKKINVVWALICLGAALSGCLPSTKASSSTSGIVSGKICYPSGDPPSLTLYFESVEYERVIPYRTHEGQRSYSLELEAGTYYAYAWVPEEFLRGGAYSAAATCGLKESCTDHSLLPVVVESRQETGGVDICDWDADPGTVPLPPGKVERAIADRLREDHPDLDADILSEVEELTVEGDVVKQINARLFRIVEEPFLNESFLITDNGIVLQMGSAVGGRGVSSMVLADLDGDRQSELYFTYSFGSGIHQSHISTYAPAYDPQKTYAAETAYQGDLKLVSDDGDRVVVRVVEGDPEAESLRILDTLGQLSLEKSGLEPELKLRLAEGLPEQVLEALILPENPEEIGSGSWMVYEDEQYGVRFAVPCFWEVRFPDQYHSSGTAYPVRNYTEEFVMSQGKRPVWEVGGIKINLNFNSGENWDLPQNAGFGDYLNANYDGLSNSELLSAEEVHINGQKGLLVTGKGTFGVSSYYLFNVGGNLFLTFAVQPASALEDPDVQGILHSLAISEDAEVAVPDLVPSDPPQGGTPACLE
jgi:hypothetical protein